MRHAQSIGLVVLAAAIAMLSGCSIYDVHSEMPKTVAAELPALLHFIKPYGGLTYTEIDDVDPDASGIQLETVVQVNDDVHNVFLEDIIIDCPQARPSSFAVTEDENGQRVARGVVTFDVPDHALNIPLRAKAADALQIANVRFVLR